MKIWHFQLLLLILQPWTKLVHLLESLGAMKFLLTPPGAFEPRSQKNNNMKKYIFIQMVKVEWHKQDYGNSKWIDFSSLIASLVSIIASMLYILSH